MSLLSDEKTSGILKMGNNGYIGKCKGMDKEVSYWLHQVVLSFEIHFKEFRHFWEWV